VTSPIFVRENAVSIILQESLLFVRKMQHLKIYLVPHDFLWPVGRESVIRCIANINFSMLVTYLLLEHNVYARAPKLLQNTAQK